MRRLDVSAAPAAGSLRRTPQGGILANSRPTRTGVLTYIYPNGQTVRELRHPDDVFHPDSLASLAGAPLTVGHPKGGTVNPGNWSALSKGHVGDDVKPDDTFVSASVRVQDEATALLIEAGSLPEMSCGYDAVMIDEAGEYLGERYDSRQTTIRYNHLALLPAGAGRAGRDVGIRLDGLAYELDEEVCVSTYLNSGMAEPVVAPAPHFDAKDYVLRTEFDKVRGELATATAQVESLTKQKNDAIDAVSPEKLDAAVNARLALVTAAKALAPEMKCDGLGALELMIGALKVAAPSVKTDGESEAFVRGVFASQSANAAAVSAAHSKVQDASTPKSDASDPVEAKKAAYAKRMSEMYGAS